MRIKNQMSVMFSTVAATLLLVGCGSSSTDSTTPTSTGYFIDAAVVGAEYNTSSGVSGITGANGSFEYNDRDRVSFSLGGLKLGECEPGTDGLVTPKLLVVGDASVPSAQQAQSINLLLRTLQSLDKDNNTSNGIDIDAATIQRLAKLNKQVDFHDVNESYLIELDNEYELGLDEDYDGHLDVNETEAENHFDESMSKWESEVEHGLDDNKTEYNDENETTSYKEFELEGYPVTQALTQEVQNTLVYMLNEEKLAYDLYINLYSYYEKNNSLEIKQFYNIASKSESKHYEVVQSLVQRYGLNDTLSTKSLDDTTNGVYDDQAVQDLYNTLYPLGQTSQEDALKVGCMVEVTDVNDLDRDIVIAQDANASDVVAAFNALRDGSYKHYWAFDKALKNLGVNDGCYYQGDALLTNKIGVYPIK